jgi:hypothetical protein
LNYIFNILYTIYKNPINIYIYKMSKATTKKAQTVYAWLGYGGVFKAGYSYITITTTYPETELDDMKKYYGDEFKGRWVKSTQSIESLTETLNEKLEEHKYSGNLYKISTSDGVKILKEVFGCTKCSTMGVYEDKEDKDEEEVKETKEVKEIKKEVKEEAKPKDKKQTKAEPEEVKEVKKEKKQTIKAEPEEVKETKQAKESKKTKPEAEKKKVKKIESDDEEEAPKKTKKSSTKTQIVLSDSSDEEEDL